MKIAIAFYQFYPNLDGSVISTYHFARELVNRGHDVTIYTTNGVKFRPVNLSSRDILDGITIERVKFLPFPFRYFFLSPSIFSKILVTDADVIFIVTLLPSFFTLASFIASKIKGLPIVLKPLVYPNRFQHDPRLFVRAFGMFFDKVIALPLIRKADSAIAITRTEATFYRKEGAKMVEIIYGGVSPMAPIPYETLSKFREKYSLAVDEKILLTVGRLEVTKGIDFMIDAMPKILDKFPNVKLLVIGEDLKGWQETLSKLATSLHCEKNIIFTGRISEAELNCAYELADVVIVPSAFEAYSRVVVEAWFHKKPVVMTRTVAIREAVPPHLDILVDYGDAEGLAKAVLNLLNDNRLAKSAAAHGFTFAREQTWNKKTDELAVILKAVVREKAKKQQEL